MKNIPDASFVRNQVRLIYRSLSPEVQEAATDTLLQFEVNMQLGEFDAVFDEACKLYQSVDKAITLFHSLIFAEDVVTRDSIVYIYAASPYLSSLKGLAVKLPITIEEHDLYKGQWTKDYIISLGGHLVTPAKNKKENYLTASFWEESKTNNALYYGKLGLEEHHQAKINIARTIEWLGLTEDLFDQTTFLRKIALEGGNLFCAINKQGKRFYLVGENVISETMAYNKFDRERAINQVAKELSCPAEQLLIIPQWTYHLDLQMAYLGHSQFIIHSFAQKDIDFGLSEEEKRKLSVTFNYLESLFEKDIIDATCTLLQMHDFEVTKVLGNLFYLNDIKDSEQRQHVPYCKNSEGFDGALALMMNGIAMDFGPKARYFVSALCDLIPFRKQFEESLQKLGITKIYDADMLESYNSKGEFEGSVDNAKSVTQVSAYYCGGLRCQTSIVSKNLSPIFNPLGAQHRFFKMAEVNNLMVNPIQPRAYLL